MDGSRSFGLGSMSRVAQRFLVWVVVPVAVHVAVILLLMNLKFLVGREVKKEAVIDTAIEEIDIRDNPVEHLAPTNVKTSLLSDRKLKWEELVKPTDTQVDGPDEKNLLEMLESYARNMADPKKNLKEIEPLIDTLQKEATRLSAEADKAVPDDAALKQIVDEFAVAANVEYVKFYRGDYL
jgi:hypothetical protein